MARATARKVLTAMEDRFSELMVVADAEGEPTPAALQFRRWDAPVPQDRTALQRLKTQGENIKKRLAGKLGKK